MSAEHYSKRPTEVAIKLRCEEIDRAIGFHEDELEKLRDERHRLAEQWMRQLPPEPEGSTSNILTNNEAMQQIGRKLSILMSRSGKRNLHTIAIHFSEDTLNRLARIVCRAHNAKKYTMAPKKIRMTRVHLVLIGILIEAKGRTVSASEFSKKTGYGEKAMPLALYTYRSPEIPIQHNENGYLLPANI